MLTRTQRIERYCKLFLIDPYNYIVAHRLFKGRRVDILSADDDIEDICDYVFSTRSASVPYVSTFLCYVILASKSRDHTSKMVLLPPAVRALEKTDFDPPWTIVDIISYGFDIISDLLFKININISSSFRV